MVLASGRGMKPGPMAGNDEFSFELTVEDLNAAALALLEARSRRWLGSRVLRAVVLAGAGAITWFLLPWRSPRSRWEDVAVLGVAMVIAAFLMPKIVAFVDRRSFLHRLQRWSARRVGARLARRSVLGPLALHFGAAHIERTNSVDTITIPYSRVRRVVSAPEVLVLQLRRPSRLLVLPGRAFTPHSTREGLLAHLQGRTPYPESLRA